MTSTATEITALTAEDVKAIQKADQVVLRHYKGETTIEASLDRRLSDEPRIYTAVEQRLYPDPSQGSAERTRFIPVHGSLASYERDSLRRGDEGDTGFWMTSSAQYNDVWRTIASLLRPGDDITVAFVGDAASNGYVKDAHLHADVVRLHVTRKGAQRPLVFEVDTSICADNTARMVRKSHYSL